MVAKLIRKEDARSTGRVFRQSRLRVCLSIMQKVQGMFKNKEACPRPAPEKLRENLFFGGSPYIQGVKYIQLLMRNPIFRLKIANSGKQGQTYRKT